MTRPSEQYHGHPRACPVCGGLKRSPLRSHRFVEGPLGDGYEIVACTECGAGFADGIPSQQALDSYYSDRSKYTYTHHGGMESPWDFERFQTTLSQLLPFMLSRDMKILDIGCATGGMLAVMRRSGYLNVLGADPSKLCAETAFKVHGINVKNGGVFDIGDWSERFDLILMLGVLEHIREVSRAVAVAKSLLTEKGYLYCAVPDVEGLTCCPNAPFQQFSFEHINFFSTGSLNNLLGASGMSPVRNWRWTTEWRLGVMEPIVSGLYRHSSVVNPTFDMQTLPALRSYIESSKIGDRGLITLIESLKNSQEPIIIWGAGTLARRLLATTPLSEVNIAAFVDSSPLIQGNQLAGRPILAPEDLRNRCETILVCSIPFQAEIIEAIHALHLLNRVLLLNK